MCVCVCVCNARALCVYVSQKGKERVRLRDLFALNVIPKYLCLNKYVGYRKKDNKQTAKNVVSLVMRNFNRFGSYLFVLKLLNKNLNKNQLCFSPQKFVRNLLMCLAYL